MAPVVRRLLGDVSERLVLLAEMLIRDEVDLYLPTKKDLDYPKILGGQPDGDLVWFPPLRATLALLSRLYLAIEVRLTLSCQQLMSA